MKKITVISMIIAVSILSGCGGKEKADPALVSQNRVNGKAIAQLNAAQYARENYPNKEVFFTGDIDSFVSMECPQGTGTQLGRSRTKFRVKP